MALKEALARLGAKKKGNCFESMEPTVGNLVAKIAIQEPTFDKIIVVYGQANTCNSFTSSCNSIHVVLEYLILNIGSSASSSSGDTLFLGLW